MSDNRTTKKTDENASILIESHKLPFKNKEDQIMLLKAIFKYGYPNLSSESFPLMSPEAVNEAIQATLGKLYDIFENIPSLVHWLHSGLFKNAESVPMALLFIEWYEQHPSHQENTECNFREIYHFLYKLTTNQVPTPMSKNSAKVLHIIITEMLSGVWLDKQHELLTYCSEIFKYRRTLHRRVYHGKRRPEEEYNV